MAEKKIGAKIVIDGEAQFRQSITSSKNALKQFESELKLTAEEFKDNEKSMEKLQKVQTIYQKQQSELQKQEKSYVEQLDKANKAHTEASAIHQKTADRVEELKKKLEDAKKAYGENSEEVKGLNSELKTAEAQYAKEEKSISNLENNMSRWNKSLNETKVELIQVDRQLEEVNHNIDNYDDYVKEAGDATAKANPEVANLGVSMGKLVGAEIIADGIKKMASACLELAKASIDVGMNFEAAMSNVGALSGATGETLDALAEKAREMGATTMFSATDAADAFSYMALAGWDANQMLTGIEPVLNLAASANMDLAKASDIVTDYLTAFQLEAKDAALFTDQLAYAMANSNTDVEMLGEAYKNCAAAAGSMGYSVEDVTGALMTMANAGVKGGEAGTSLRAIMINLATNTNECADTLEKMGVKIYDSQGNMNSLSEILVGTAAAFDGLSDSESNALAKQIAGKTQYTGFQTIMLGLSDAAKEAGMSMTDYAEALRNCDGYAKEMAETMQDNLKGKLTILDSSLQALEESFYDVFDADLKRGVDGATDAVTRLNDAVKKGDLNTSLQRISKELDVLIENAIEWLETNLPNIVDGLADILENTNHILPVVKGIAEGLIAYKSAATAVSIAQGAMALFATTTAAAEGAQLGLNAAAAANPYVLLAGLLVGIVAATANWVSTNEDVILQLSDIDRDAKKMAESADQALSSINDNIEARKLNRESMEDEAGYVESLVEKFEKLRQGYELNGANAEELKIVIEQLNEEMPDLNLAIDEQTGKINLTNEALETNVELLMRKARVAAAQEDLTQIAKEQYEAEKQLKELNEQRNKLDEEYSKNAKALKDNQDSWNKSIQDGTAILEEYNGQETYLQQQALNSKAALDEQDEKIKETEDAINALSEEYKDCQYYIQTNNYALVEASDKLDNVGNSAKQTAGELATMNEEFQKSVEELNEGVQKALESSNSIFDKTKETESRNIDEMRSNIQSHVDQINQWKDSYDELATRVDDSTGSALEYIANLGIEGQGYIDELLSLSKTDLDAFIKDMENALSLPAEAAKSVTDSYTKAVQESIDGMRKIAQDEAKEGSATKKAAKDVGDILPDELEKALGEDGKNVTDKVKDATDGVEAVLTESAEPVKTEAEALAKTITEPIESNVTYKKFYDIGGYVADGLKDGMNSKLEEVRRAADEISRVVEEASRKRLEINSPSKVFERIGGYVGEGLQIGISDSMSDVVNTLNNTLPNEKNVEVSNYTTASTTFDNAVGNGTLAKIDKLLNDYLPQLSNQQIVLDTGATVGALANPMNRALGKIAYRGM